MANYILGDVMRAEAFAVNKDGKLVHYFDANTMTDSTINISTTAEEIRGGWGNQLLGKIFHDSNFAVNLTEAMWSLDYLAAQIGADIAEDGETFDLQYVKKAAGAEGALTLTVATDLNNNQIVPMFQTTNGFCSSTNALIVWGKDCDDKIHTFTATPDQKDKAATSYTLTAIDGTTFKENDVICITYPVAATNCQQIIVNAAYAPKEFSLYLYGKIFAGNGCQKSKGKKVGKFVIEIPRFQLDGTVDLTMNPSSAATTSLNGSALAYGCTCNGENEYAKISVVLDKAETKE